VNGSSQNKDRYQKALLNFENFVNAFIKALAKIEPELHEVSAKHCIFRIYRDIRFSKNKTPYKDHFGAHITEAGRKSPGPGYYFHLKPSGSFLAGGIFGPDSAKLAAIRQEIDYNSKEFLSILESDSFKSTFSKLEGDQLKTAPKGYEQDHEMIEYLRYKSFLLVHQFTDEEIFNKNFLYRLVEISKEIYPFHQFIRKALS